MSSSDEVIRQKIRQGFPLVNKHPDVAGLLRNAELLPLLGKALAEPFRAMHVSAVLAPEARGPILGALVAVELSAGLILARKDGRNHPGADLPVTSEPTWRGTSETFLGRTFDLNPTDRVIIVDDWVTTGSTLRAARSIIASSGATYLGAAALVDKATSATRNELQVHAVVAFEDLVRAHPEDDSAR